MHVITDLNLRGAEMMLYRLPQSPPLASCEHRVVSLTSLGVIEIPVNHRPRRFGSSKYGVMNRAFVAFADLLVVRWMKSRTLRYEIAEDLGGDLVRD